MKHPFDLPEEDLDTEESPLTERVSRRRALIAALAGVGGIAANSVAQDITTQALGEEGGPKVTTDAVGEEGGKPGVVPPVGTTKAVGEEGGPVATTLAIGEEGGKPTTLALGEEGGPKVPGEEIARLAAQVTDHLSKGDLASAYKVYSEAKKKATGRLAALLNNARIQIEAVANFEIGRAVKESDAATLTNIAAMSDLAASARAKKHSMKKP